MENEIVILPKGSQLTWDEIKVLEAVNTGEVDFAEFESYYEQYSAWR